jgi:hypothetical protein
LGFSINMPFSNSSIPFYIRLILMPVLLVVTPGATILYGQQGSGVQINEVMASNSDIIPDDDGDYSDWIELYNLGSEPVGLAGFGLSDDSAQPFKWILPDTTLQPGAIMLIWASGKNRAQPGAPLHTNFAIAASGEEIVLTHTSGARLDVLPATSIPTNVSIGRLPDGSPEWYLFDEPTPGSPNITTGYTEFLTPPVFSHEAGFYHDSFLLSLTHEDPTVQIIYTLDGSEPSLDNIQGVAYNHMYEYLGPDKRLVEKTYKSNLYDLASPIEIRDRTMEPNYFSRMHTSVENRTSPYYFPRELIFKATVVRARAVKNGALASPVNTHTYLVTPEGRDRFTLPVVSLSVQEDHLFDFESGIYVPGKILDDQNLERFENNPQANYSQAGIEWERKATIELLEASSSTVNYRNDIGIRIHGGWSRAFPMKSLRLYARNEYGDNRFRYPMFPDQPYSNYNRLILRNGGNDWDGTLLRDPLLQRIVQHMNIDTQAYRPVIVFLNGEYWGIHGLRERYDDHYLSRKYGVESENIDLLSRNRIVINGTSDHYTETLDYIRQNGLASDSAYAYIQTRIDTENYIDYQIAQIFVANLDWPGNNIFYWRKRTNQYEPDAPPQQDGRWRWLVYDMDFGFHRYRNCAVIESSICGPVDLNTLAMATGDLSWFGNPTWSTELFRALLTNTSFRNDFINRYLDQLNTAFLPERTVQLIHEMSSRLDPEMDEHLERWFSRRDDLNYNNWKLRIDTQLIPFAEERPFYAKNHLKEFFGIEKEHTITVNVDDQTTGYIHVNTIAILEDTPGVNATPYPWTGIYFERIPVRLSATPFEGYKFSHWIINGERWDDDSVTLTLHADMLVTAHFAESEIPPIAERQLLHYFIFQSIPNDTPLRSVSAVFAEAGPARVHFTSSLEGYPFTNVHPNWRQGSMERRNQPTPINYRPEGNANVAYANAGSIRALQIKQPFAVGDRENTLVLHLPTTGFEHPALSFAAMDENAGALGLRIDYAVTFDLVTRTDGLVDTVFTWTSDGLSATDRYKILANGTYQYYSADFAGIEGTSDNPHFRVRIRFDVRDATLANGDRVTFNNIALDGTPKSVSAPIASDLPASFELGQNYPNPFNPVTNIPFTLSQPEHVRLEIYTLLGQRVAILRDEVMQAGWHTTQFDAGNLASGVYLYRLQTPNEVQTRKLLLIR